MENEHSQTKSPFATEPVGRLIARFAIPCVISLLVNSLYNIVDQIFIGWGVGYLGNGATNVVFPITIVALALSLMIGDGGAAYLSLQLGEKDVENARCGTHGGVPGLSGPGADAVRRYRCAASLRAGIRGLSSAWGCPS